MSERNYYVLCEDNCRFPAMTKEETLAAITQAVEGHEISDVDTGFVTKIKEKNRNVALSFWVGTQAEYNALEAPENNCFYIITDETEKDDILSRISALEGAPLKNRVLWEGSAEVEDAIVIESGGIEGYKIFAFTVGKNNDSAVGDKTFIAFRSPAENPGEHTGYSDYEFIEFSGITSIEDDFYNYYARVYIVDSESEEQQMFVFAKGFSAALPNMTGSGSLYIKKIIGIY